MYRGFHELFRNGKSKRKIKLLRNEKKGELVSAAAVIPRDTIGLKVRIGEKLKRTQRQNTPPHKKKKGPPQKKTNKKTTQKKNQ